MKTGNNVARPALVVAAYGRRGELEIRDGRRTGFLVRRRQTRVVCGDRVRWAPQQPGEPVIVEEILPRTNELERLSSDGRRPEILAANLTRLLVVFAGQPKTDWFLVDRYICAAELMRCEAIVIHNKKDLVDHADEAREYGHLGYELIRTSTRNGKGISRLRASLSGQVGILVGQSGVGKSSLINALAPGADAAIGNLSNATSEGRHTTTASIMHEMSGNGRLIDTPGVRDFVPMIRDPRSVQQGFREIASAAHDCRFADCRHLREPGCAVGSKVATGEISARRLESYKRLLRAVTVESQD